MHKELTLHTLKMISSFFLKLEKKRRSQLVLFKSSKMLQKKIIKDHRILIKSGIACSAPILKLSLFKNFLKKANIYLSFVRVNKKILNIAKILKRTFMFKSSKSLVTYITELFISLVEGVQTPAIKASANSQMDNLTLKKFFRFKWF